MHTVDVVIPLYNCAQYIRQAIDSVQKQSAAISTIIVVDDGSTDAGPAIVGELAQKDKRIVLLQGPNQGPSAARNKGIQAATAELVAFLDADDAWEPTKIAMQVTAFHQNPSCAFVHTQAYAIDPAGTPVTAKLYNTNTDIAATFDTIRLGQYTVTGSASSVITSRELLHQAGLFDDQLLLGGEDWDMWARLAQWGEVEFLDHPLVKIRINPASFQRSVSAYTRAQSRLHSRIMVARHWEHDDNFMQAHRIEARRDAWAVMRWILCKPTALYAFYGEMRHHKIHAGRIIFSGPLDFIAAIMQGLARTAVDIIRSPSEIQRLWNRFIDERRP